MYYRRLNKFLQSQVKVVIATIDLPYYESNKYVGDEIEKDHEELGG